MHFAKTCRVCLSGSDELTPLRVRLPGKNKTFEETINFVVNIDIVLEHGLPDKICKECGTMLDVADTFKQRCLDSEAALVQFEKGGGTDESPPKFEENDRVIGEKCSEDTYIVPTVISCASLSDSLVAQVKIDENVPKPKIKIEIVEEECTEDETTTEQDDKQEFEAPLTKVKDELLVKEEILEIPLNYINEEDFLLKPMQHLEMLHHSCIECGKDFPSRGSLESHRKDGPCPQKLYPDDIKPSTSGLTAAIDQEATHHSAEGSQAALSAHGIRVRKRGRPPKLGDRQNDTKTGSKTKKKPLNNLKQKAKTNKVARRFICNECGRVYARKDHLEGHMKIHMGEKPYSCKVCQKKFKRKMTLENHSRTHTGHRPYACSICEKSFSQKAHLDSHEMTHFGSKPFSCNLCEKRFSRRRNLKMHNRTHTGEKPFSCNVCFKSFSMKSTLQKHEMAHTGDRPYSCHICEKTFIQKPHLDSHIRIHTGGKPYSCYICEKKFRESSGVYKHVRTQHEGIKPFSCDVCMRTYSNSSGLKRHSCKIKQS